MKVRCRVGPTRSSCCFSAWPSSSPSPQASAPTLDPEVLRIFQLADTAICALFFADFLYTLYKAADRKRYFVTWGWIDLLSSIPQVGWLSGSEYVRWGRAARVLRLVRGIRSLRTVLEFVSNKRAESAALTATFVAILAVVLSSIAVLQVEKANPGANIVNAGDALWWATVTVTTVGYGDLFPVTAVGRVIAAGLMLLGIGVFLTVAAFVASWFLGPAEAEQEEELELIRKELTMIRERLDRDAAG